MKDVASIFKCQSLNYFLHAIIYVLLSSYLNIWFVYYFKFENWFISYILVFFVVLMQCKVGESSKEMSYPLENNHTMEE